MDPRLWRLLTAKHWFMTFDFRAENDNRNELLERHLYFAWLQKSGTWSGIKFSSDGFISRGLRASILLYPLLYLFTSWWNYYEGCCWNWFWHLCTEIRAISVSVLAYFGVVLYAWFIPHCWSSCMRRLSWFIYSTLWLFNLHQQQCFMAVWRCNWQCMG